VTVVFEESEIGEVSPVVVPARVRDWVAVYALEKLHHDPEVEDASEGKVMVFDGPEVRRKVVDTTLDDAVKSTLVPDTLDVAYR